MENELLTRPESRHANPDSDARVFDRGHLPTARVWSKRIQRVVTITASDFNSDQYGLIDPETDEPVDE